jgi:hypothetical protein
MPPRNTSIALSLTKWTSTDLSPSSEEARVSPDTLRWRKLNSDIFLPPKPIVQGIDDQDPYRVCIPGPLPISPLRNEALGESHSLLKNAPHLLEEIENMLNVRSIEFCNMTTLLRYQDGFEPQERDQTVLIVAPQRLDSAWTVFLHDVTERCDLSELGLRWRVEIIDPAALYDKIMFPPGGHLTDQLERAWETDIKPALEAMLKSSGLEYWSVHLGRRGYVEREARMTVAIVVSVESRDNWQPMKRWMAKLVETSGFDLDVEIRRVVVRSAGYRPCQMAV